MRHLSTLLPTPHVDGYVRMPEAALSDLELAHVDSALDRDLLEDLRAEGVDASTAGYTEWQHSGTPGGQAYVTLGWDWYVDRASGALLVAWGDIRSNVMCVDPRGLDLGMARTAQALLRRVAGLNWPNPVAQAALASCGETPARGPTLQ